MQDERAPLRWLNEPAYWRSPAEGELELSVQGRTDFWRYTKTGAYQHDGHVFGRSLAGDFDLRTEVLGDLKEQYDQVGLIAIASEEVWLKAGVELDGSLWLSTVNTRGASDWARERWGALPLTIRLTRAADCVHAAVGTAAGWRMCRELTLAGSVFAGIYACSPLGEGFRARVQSLTITDLEPSGGERPGG